MSDWISVDNIGAAQKEDNCCLDPMDVERYSVPLLVWDEDEADYFKASYDFRKGRWEDCSNGNALGGVTHFQPLPAPPESPSCAS